MDQSLDEHPEIRRLRSEIGVMSSELAERLAELHDLEHIVRPNLLAIYQSKIGPWELRLLEVQCEAARWKRRVELARAALNRGEMFDVALIEAELDREFAAWRARLAEAAAEIRSAQFRLSHPLSAKDDRDLKKLFREIARKLHPDLNPAAAQSDRSLWNDVLEAYDAGDLQKLRALSILVEHDGPVPKALEGLEQLRTEHRRLRESLEGLYRHLAEVRKQPPFSEGDNWQSEQWLSRRRKEIDEKIAAAKAQAQALRHAFPQLSSGSGQKPGLN